MPSRDLVVVLVGNVNHTTLPYQYRYKIPRRHLQESQPPSPNFTQDHTIASPSHPRRRGTYRTYQVVPRTLLQPSSLYRSSRIGHCVFRSECRTRSDLATGNPGALVPAAVWEVLGVTSRDLVVVLVGRCRVIYISGMHRVGIGPL